MPYSGNVFYWDSNVFLSYINAVPERIQIVRDLLSEIQDDPESIILTSSQSIVEVTHATVERVHNLLNPEILKKIDTMWDDKSFVDIIDNGPHIAMIGQKLIRDAIPAGWALKPYDAIHLATASWYNKNVSQIHEFHTYDRKLHKYGPMIGVTINPPSVVQFRLNME